MNITPLTPNTADKMFRDICVRACIEASKPLDVIVAASNIKTLDDACTLARQTVAELDRAGLEVPERVRMFATPEDWAEGEAENCDPYANYSRDTGLHHPECQCNRCNGIIPASEY